MLEANPFRHDPRRGSCRVRQPARDAISITWPLTGAEAVVMLTGIFFDGRNITSRRQVNEFLPRIVGKTEDIFFRQSREVSF
jgi:hypothetical protein